MKSAREVDVGSGEVAERLPFLTPGTQLLECADVVVLVDLLLLFEQNFTALLHCRRDVELLGSIFPLLPVLLDLYHDFRDLLVDACGGFRLLLLDSGLFDLLGLADLHHNRVSLLVL